MTDQHECQLLAPADLSVVVPVRAAGEMLQRCLHHLSTCSPPPGEVIVVADGPGDGSHRAAISEAGSLPIRLIELPAPLGAAAARNAGARTASGRVLFFVDADVAVAPDAPLRVVKALNNRPDWSAVFGSYDDRPGAGNLISQYKGLLNHYVHQHAREEGFTFWTALGAIRRDAFMAMGGFDPASRLEDVELGYRLHASGHRVGVVKSLLATHLKRWRATSLLWSDIWVRAVPWTQLLYQYRSAERDLNLDNANRVSVIAAYALIASIAAVAAWPAVGAAIAAACVAVLLVVNRRLYGFFAHRRGPLFAVGAIGWHWIYFLCCGVGFAIGTAAYLLSRTRRSAAVASGAPSAEVPA